MDRFSRGVLFSEYFGDYGFNISGTKIMGQFFHMTYVVSPDNMSDFVWFTSV